MKSLLSNLPKIVETANKRKGRGLGSGSGSKSSRGTTRHQGAREEIPIHFEGGQGRLVKRFPLLRGKGKNNVKRSKGTRIPLKHLSSFKDGDIVDIEALIKKGLVEKLVRKEGAKIIGGGTVDKKLTVRVAVTASVKKHIEKLGGVVEVAKSP